MELQTAKRFEQDYRKILRRMKREKIKLEDAPKEIQEAVLALHQNALLVMEHERRKKKCRTRNSK